MAKFPSIEAVSYVLAHVPDLVRYGSKPAREIQRTRSYEKLISKSLRSFEEAAGYLPHQVFLGGADPDRLRQMPQPWWKSTLIPAENGMGRLYSQAGFYGLLRCCDHFDLVEMERSFAQEAREHLDREGLYSPSRLSRLEKAASGNDSRRAPADSNACALYSGEQVIGFIKSAYEKDESLRAPVLLENLAAKTTAVMAVTELLHRHPQIEPESIEYVINSGEEAVGDRYQRGGGGIAKAVAEQVGLINATGSDVKAFCCGPLHGMVLAAALVQAGVYARVLLVGGASLAKLGMKFLGHLKAEMPILEDVLAGFAVVIGRNNGADPLIRLDVVGKHDVRCHSSAQGIAEALVLRPLRQASRRLTEIDKYAVELHNPEITKPAGSGDVPASNYRVISTLAAIHGEITKEEIPAFIEQRGMLGFAPTQGHVASAIPFLGHARRSIIEGKIRNTFLIGKGSLFLGRMTQMADGFSFLVEHP